MLPPNAVNPIFASIAILITSLKKATKANVAKAVIIAVNFNSTYGVWNDSLILKCFECASLNINFSEGDYMCVARTPPILLLFLKEERT